MPIFLSANLFEKIWWRLTGSNRRPSACKADALPTELNLQDEFLYIKIAIKINISKNDGSFEPFFIIIMAPAVGLEPTTP